MTLAGGLMLLASSCRKHLLDQLPTTELASSVFWKSPDDATDALMGAYAAVRGVFDRDYYFDGQGEYVRDRSGTNSTVSGDLIHGGAYNGGNYNPTGYAGSFDTYFKYLYGAVDRCNYVIDNVEKMITTLPDDSLELKGIIGEARLLRGMVYFRLISMWGDVPYIAHVITDNAQLNDETRMPLEQVKDSILADFNYARTYLPATPPALGRAAQPAALAFRGKLELFWACWNHFGWPELDTFTPRASAADSGYKEAAFDFDTVITQYNLTLFRGGEPGDIDSLGKADVLPNYYYEFTPLANGDPSFLMSFTHGGTGTGQGEELMRDFSGRNFEGSQVWLIPRYEIADRYQSTVTGDFCPPLIPMNPSSDPTARTTLNSAVNPNSYRDRDYRMKSSIVWDYEMMEGMASLKATGWVPFIYQTWNQAITIDGQHYMTYNTDGCNSGYVFRKFVRNYAGQGRSDGDYAWPVMRLADVYLMYAEATNAYKGPTADAINLVNEIRHGGNLPPLAASKTANADVFFQSIEQERIVELLGEGQRSFDIRRWRQLADIWGPPGGDGKWRIDTHGANQQRYYQNTSERTYEQNYIFKIPQSEIDRNPKLIQNKPWR